MWEAVAITLRESFQRLAVNAARLVPGLLATLVFALLSLALAWACARLVRRILKAVQLDRLLRRWAPAEDRSRLPSLVTGATRFTFWLTFAVGLALSLTSVESRWTSALAERVLTYAPSVIVAGVLFAAAVALSRWVEASVLVSAVNMQIRSARLLATGARWLVTVLGGAMALQHLGVGGALVTISFSILFGGIVLALALAVGLGSREVVTRSWERRLRDRDEAHPHDEEPPRIAHL